MKLSDIKPDGKNANRGTARGAKAIVNSMQRSGFGRSGLLDKNNKAIAGNKTTEAAAEVFGVDVEPIIVETDGTRPVYVKRTDLDLDDPDPNNPARQLAYADNMTSWASFELDPAQVMADIEAGFDFEEVDITLPDLGELLGKAAGELLAGDNEGADTEPQIDKAEELRQKWSTEPGQLWQLGEHRLICGDCTDAAVVERVMGGERAEMMFTDPPYNVGYEGNYIQSGKILKEKEKIWLGGINNDSLVDFHSWLSMAYRVIDAFLGEGCAIYIWHPSGAEGRHFWDAWLWREWHFQVDLIWNKTSLIISRWDYKPQHEPVMYGWKGKNRTWAGPNNEPTVWDFPRQQGNSGDKRYHPTQKSPYLAERPIKNHNAKIVLDPFSGSGTTIIACENLSRRARAIEIDPGYVAVALQRWADHTGQTPVLLTNLAV